MIIYRYDMGIAASALILACGFMLGCESATDGSALESDAPTGQLAVSPAGPIALGYFEQQVFTVTLTDADGLPLADEPIQASLIGPAHNGGLSPFELTTDAEGAAEVVFAAPDQEAQLQVRFSSPASSDEALVDVTVDPAALALTVELGYAGDRLLADAVLEAYADTSCVELATGNGPEPFDTETTGPPPSSVVFTGLHAEAEYAVSAVGRNGTGEHRAVACVDGLLPNGETAQLTLEDLPLELAGLFEVTTTVVTDAVLDPAVDSLAGSLEPFADDVPDAILDAIRDEIDDEPLAGETFDQIRSDEGLDAELDADFVERAVDVSGTLAALWSQVKSRLATVELDGTIEISAPEDGIYDLFHSLGRIAFDGVAESFVVAVPEIAETTAEVAPEDIDHLLLENHAVGLGIGGPLEFVLGEEIELSLGALDLPTALENEIDCEAVVAVLALPLEGVADSSSILAGCQDAMLEAGEQLEDGVAVLSANYGQILFDGGSCRLADPGGGDQVGQLADGEFVVQWTGSDTLGPMSGTFVGELAAD